jgi:hypothetical protein
LIFDLLLLIFQLLQWNIVSPQAQYLSFGGNLFNSSLPTELGMLAGLRKLRAFQNKLTGPIPTTIGRLQLLDSLELDDNLLSMTLPTELGELLDLEILFLSDNHFLGTLPSEFGRLRNLEVVTLNNCPNITGPIPAEWNELVGLGSLEELYLIE